MPPKAEELLQELPPPQELSPLHEEDLLLHMDAPTAAPAAPAKNGERGTKSSEHMQLKMEHITTTNANEPSREDGSLS